MRAVIVVLLASLGLAACSEQQTAKLQQDASAAIGGVHRVVADSSAPLGELRQKAGQLAQDASAALGVATRVGKAAAALDPELGQQLDEARQQVDAVKEAASALKP